MEAAEQAADRPKPVRDAVPTSIDKAFDVCETLSAAPEGLTLTDLARVVDLPRPSVHRLLAILKRREYVAQDPVSQRYSLSLRMLDLSLRRLGRSELRLHAFSVLRDRAVGPQARSFVAVPSFDEVTYAWQGIDSGPAMRTVYGRPMPAHCAMYFTDTPGRRRLTCFRLAPVGYPGNSTEGPVVLGPAPVETAQRLVCSCAPVCDYSGREVARVGVFGHGPDVAKMAADVSRDAADLGRLVSARLGYLPEAGRTGQRD
jgi:hypothetical protein